MARKQLSIPQDDTDVLAWIEEKKRGEGYSEAIRELIRKDIAQERGATSAAEGDLSPGEIRQIVREEVRAALQGLTLRDDNSAAQGEDLSEEVLNDLASMQF